MRGGGRLKRGVVCTVHLRALAGGGSLLLRILFAVRVFGVRGAIMTNLGNIALVLDEAKHGVLNGLCTLSKMEQNAKFYDCEVVMISVLRQLQKFMAWTYPDQLSTVAERLTSIVDRHDLIVIQRLLEAKDVNIVTVAHGLTPDVVMCTKVAHYNVQDIRLAFVRAITMGYRYSCMDDHHVVQFIETSLVFAKNVCGDISRKLDKADSKILDDSGTNMKNVNIFLNYMSKRNIGGDQSEERYAKFMSWIFNGEFLSPMEGVRCSMVSKGSFQMLSSTVLDAEFAFYSDMQMVAQEMYNSMFQENMSRVGPTKMRMFIFPNSLNVSALCKCPFVARPHPQFICKSKKAGPNNMKNMMQDKYVNYLDNLANTAIRAGVTVSLPEVVNKFPKKTQDERARAEECKREIMSVIPKQKNASCILPLRTVLSGKKWRCSAGMCFPVVIVGIPNNACENCLKQAIASAC